MVQVFLQVIALKCVIQSFFVLSSLRTKRQFARLLHEFIFCSLLEELHQIGASLAPFQLIKKELTSQAPERAEGCTARQQALTSAS
jgi:hypothetical protein